MTENLQEKKQLNILVVDDEAAVRKLLTTLITLTGNQVSTANDGVQAARLIELPEPPFDLVITDHQMPQMTGLQLVRQLKNDGFSGKIIVMTAFLSNEEEVEYMALGVADIIKKPFNISEFRAWFSRLEAGKDANH